MDNRLFFPATLRNQEPIGNVLADYLPENGTVLEIASGSGEHAVAFQRRFPKIRWQSSDLKTAHIESIRSWIEHNQLTTQMPSPIRLDVENYPWQLSERSLLDIKAIVCINLIHISNLSCTEALFRNSGRVLRIGSPLILYGPIKKNGKHISQSNQEFDHSLKARNRNWGIRNLEDINKSAQFYRFKEAILRKMPANNHAMIFIKD